MSVVKSAAKLSLYLFSFFVIIFVVGVGYLYMNMNSLAKDIAQDVASNALGVPVIISDIDIKLEDKKVVVNGISISNPDGYKKDHAIKVARVTVAMENWSKDLLTFAMVGVDGTQVNLEVQPRGTNLGDLKKNIEARSKTVQGNEPSAAQVADVESKKENIKVIVRDFALTGAQLKPSITLLGGDLNVITVPDIHLQGVGEKENGLLAHEAVAQIMNGVLQEFNKSANSAGFLEGLPLDVMNDIGVSTIDVFQKNLKKSYESEVDKFKKGFDGLKDMIQQ
ncbi:MAG: hypothetical protein ACRBDI_04405 [Alphaproteobacteria bacterium]